MMDKIPIHPSHYIGLSKVVLRLSIMLGVLLLAFLMPIPESLRGVSGYEPLHSLLETIAIIISGLIFAVVWNSLSYKENCTMLLVGCGFLGVALFDFSHMISVEGMPDFITPSDGEKAINFWLSARLMAVMTLLVAVVTLGKEIKFGLNRYALLSITILIVALVHWLFLYHSNWIPRTFITGQGLTDFKKNSEYFIIGLNVVAMWWLLIRMREPLRFNATALLGALAVTGLSEVFFTLYSSLNDIFLVLGHVYKIVAYVFLYQTLFVETMSRPYQDIIAFKDTLDKTQELANLGSWEYEPEINRLFWSDQVYYLFGLLPQESVASYKGFLAHVHPDDRSLVDAAYTDSVLNGADGYEIEYRILRGHSAEVRYVHEKCEHVRDAAGKVVLSRGMVHDITQRKEAEKDLRNSNEQFRNLFEESPLGIALIDSLTGHIFEVNPMFSKIAGRTPQEMKNIDWMAITHPDDVQEVLDNMALMNSGKTSGFQMNKRYIHSDGSIVWINMTIARVSNEKQTSPRHLCMIKDITEHKRVEEQLQIRQRMDSLGTLVGGISHDFNNILGAVVGNLELLSMHNENFHEKQHKFLINAIKSTNRAVELIKQFQTLSTVTANNKTLVDIYDIAEEVFCLLRETSDRLVRKEVKFKKGEFFVTANSGELHQVLLNLATNSKQALEEQELTNSDYIEISAENYQVIAIEKTGLVEGDYIHISFKDTGSGMSDDILNKAFDPMFTTKNKDNKRGQGLGLAMVYNIITKHNQGYIEIESSKGKGTTFHIYLPKAQTKLTADSKKKVSSKGGTESLLLVDDDEMIANMAKEILNGAGYAVLVANDGMQALEIYKQRRDSISAVILDLNMPKMSGKQVFEEMIKINSKVKVIISSGYGEEDSYQGILSQAKGNLSKPYKLADLYSVVRSVIDS